MSASAPRSETASPRPLVLIVDDYDDALDMYGFYLKSQGYEVLTASDGPEGLELARAHRPAVILLDIRMPGMSGNDVVRSLRADLRFATTPIVALTSHALEAEIAAVRSAGFDEVISKPCLPDALVDVVERMLQRTLLRRA
jgi:two-component system, cell cycle response regulator DivK